MVNDDYMTKPFDETELRARVGNIIDIRNILSRKAGQSLESTKPSDASEESPSETQPKVLNKKEQAFVDKLMKVIEENYQNPGLKRQEIASLMAVSDRQLNRKVKALLNNNPMNLLREFKLDRSKQMLLDGEQIATVADILGFSNPSYFIKCFKSQFEITPKQFQAKQRINDR